MIRFLFIIISSSLPRYFEKISVMPYRSNYKRNSYAYERAYEDIFHTRWGATTRANSEPKV